MITVDVLSCEFSIEHWQVNIYLEVKYNQILLFSLSLFANSGLFYLLQKFCLFSHSEITMLFCFSLSQVSSFTTVFPQWTWVCGPTAWVECLKHVAVSKIALQYRKLCSSVLDPKTTVIYCGSPVKVFSYKSIGPMQLFLGCIRWFTIGDDTSSFPHNAILTFYSISPQYKSEGGRISLHNTMSVGYSTITPA